MNMSTIFVAARHAFRDLARSSWLAAYAGFFFLAAASLFQFSDTGTKALLSLASVVLFVVPLATAVFGTIYLYSTRELLELLLAQPVRRIDLYVGLYFGLTVPLAGAAAAGIAAGFVFTGAPPSSIPLGLTIVGVASVLTAVFTGIAAAIAFSVDDRVRGLATVIAMWLLLAIVYDGLVLAVGANLSAYPLEKPMLALMVANPIDLARLVLLPHFDAAALLGYTGAVYQRFFAGTTGVVVTALTLAAWVLIPAAAGARSFKRKDF